MNKKIQKRKKRQTHVSFHYSVSHPKIIIKNKKNTKEFNIILNNILTCKYSEGNKCESVSTQCYSVKKKEGVRLQYVKSKMKPRTSIIIYYETIVSKTSQRGKSISTNKFARFDGFLLGHIKTVQQPILKLALRSLHHIQTRKVFYIDLL